MAYNQKEDFSNDLQELYDKLPAHGYTEAREGLEKLKLQVKLFGFHYAGIDIRQESTEHEKALANVLQCTGKCNDYMILVEEGKEQILNELLEEQNNRQLSQKDDARWLHATYLKQYPTWS